MELKNVRVAVHNLGCKVNSYELDVMTEKLKRAGCIMVPFTEKADVYVINTCTVTNIADRKSRQMLHKAKKENPDAVVVAVGCYVETDGKRIETDPAIDLAIGNNRKGQIAELLEEYLAGNRKDKTMEGETLTDLTDHPAFESMHLTTPGRTRAFLKIQDGCNQFCSYCIIPYARGRIRSRDPEEILSEVQGLASEGVKEVVLDGIHISSYGMEKGENPEEALLDLIRRIALIHGIERIRLGSFEPRILTPAFVTGIAKVDKICPHFHISLQSGCNATLKRMNRHYTAEEYYEAVERLRSAFENPALTTDVIVGFPGESEEEFNECVAFLKKVHFFEIHVFKYSRRHGTVADKMPDQKTEAQKAARSHVLLDLTHEEAIEYRSSFIGKEEEILLEEVRTVDGKDYFVGHTKRYVEGLVPAEGKREGQLVKGGFIGLTSDGQALYMREK